MKFVAMSSGAGLFLFVSLMYLFLAHCECIGISSVTAAKIKFAIRMFEENGHLCSLLVRDWQIKS